jgi:protein-tyrosine phosphatase
VIDLHVHALSGIDDGPPTLADAVALAKAAHEDGTRTLVATPHVSERYPNTPDTIDAAAAALRQRLRTEGVAISIVTGAEIAVDRLPTLDDAALARLTLGAGPYLMIESPLRASSGDIEGPLLHLLSEGHRVVLAHPERSPTFHREPLLLGRLVGLGILTSVTAAAFTGAFGRTVHRFAERMLGEGLVHNVASDAHDVGTRPPIIADAVAQIGSAPSDPWRDWVLRAVPEAVLGGDPVPAAPHAPALPRRGLRRLLGPR